MFALRVTYLTGRVYSAEFDDGDDKNAVEWPPHPSRLFSAMVSAWGESGQDPDGAAALEWLERQNAPRIIASDATPRSLVQHFVPVNDIRSLPEDRPRKGRTFPSAYLDEPNVYFVWESELPPELKQGMDEVLARTCALGHSSCLVEVSVADPPPPDGEAWIPDDAGEVRLRVPYAGRFSELRSRYARFVDDPIKVNRPNGGKAIRYGKGGVCPDVESPSGLFDEMFILRKVEGPRTSLLSTLSVTAALRGALMKHGPQPVPGFLSGHHANSTADNPRPAEAPHVAYAPVAFVGGKYAEAELMGVAALLPRISTPEERGVCIGALTNVKQLAMPWGIWKVEIADEEETRVNLRPEVWTRSANVWSTVTPLVFDRYPNEPYGKEAENIVRRSIVRAGFPEPVEIQLHYNAWHIGVPKAKHFPPAPSRSGKPQRFHCHVWARFGERVTGPMVAGAGRFYGYGLFRPHVARQG